MVDELTGLRVRIHIDEQGTAHTSRRPSGTIVRKLLGSNGVVYPVIHFDGPVLLRGSGTEADRTLTIAVVAAAEPGASLDPIMSLDTGNPLDVGIFRPTEPLDEATEFLDPSRLTYLAMGRLERA